MEIPWHRVVSSCGRISLSGPAAAEQRRLLRREGTSVNGLTVDLEAHRWKGGRDCRPLNDAG
jgi:alkylated DNA nucleotide flippase Atl1